MAFEGSNRSLNMSSHSANKQGNDNSFNSHNSSMASIDMQGSGNVCLDDIRKMQQNDRVKYAIQKYVNDPNTRVGSQSEKSFQKA